MRQQKGAVRFCNYIYPTAKAIGLYKKFKYIKQDLESGNTVEELETTKRWDRREIQSRIEESFYSWLNKTTEIEMAKNGARTMEEILQKIGKTEAVIVRNMKDQEEKQDI
ncbi:hypothetical protein RF11_03991 [Thelohanellus kitauei]|uniref:Uncharacterized protein n=1 Tax=Thelohanellus kitauei TaxID=669202 RepID=A0A0C2M149_THEKT|nr:hypothetical protein RF11_03991 [Thelohanellus kitauei]